jgi:hypothetical protein
MTGDTVPRRLRADARRNVDALLDAAKAVFFASGVNAPAKEIADLAGTPSSSRPNEGSPPLADGLRYRAEGQRP